MQNNLINYLPKWTEKVTIKIGGRDPLGLSRYSAFLSEFLLNGIITTTDRARYYSFYTWVVWCFNNKDIKHNYNTFIDFMRKREAFAGLCGKHSQVDEKLVGKLKISKFYELGLKNGEFNFNFQVLPANRLGGYGQYYKGSLKYLELVKQNNYGFEEVTEKGIKIAESYNNSISNIIDNIEDTFEGEIVDIKKLNKVSKYFSLDFLSNPLAKNEKQDLINLFFDNNDFDLRNESLTLILHIISEYEKYSENVWLKRLDFYLVYPVFYYNAILFEDDTVKPYNPPEFLSYCCDFWKDFCIHEFLTFAIELLMYSVLKILDKNKYGLSIDEICNQLVNDEFKEVAGNTESFYELLDIFDIEEISEQEKSNEIQKKFSILSTDRENVLNNELDIIMSLNNIDNSPQCFAGNAVYILGLLYAKWRKYKSPIEQHPHLNIKLVLPALDKFSTNELLDWKEFLKEFIYKFIVSQHEQITYEKRNFDGIWFSFDNNIVKKEKDFDFPHFRESRQSSVVHILNDLGLLKKERIEDDTMFSLTKDGKELLKKLLSREI